MSEISSNMLNQAIVDANALKEVAMKNAENLLVERYSEKIKEAIDSILEQDDEDEEEELAASEEIPDVGSLADLGIDTGKESEVAADVPLAAIDGEKLCACPDKEEEIEIDFNELEKQIAAAEEEPEETHEELASELSAEIPEKGEEENAKEKREEEGEEEELELDEKELKEMLEHVKVDIAPVPSGWRVNNQAFREDILDVALAQEQDTDIKKENEELRAALNVLKEEKNKVLDSNKKYKKLFTELKNKLEGILLTNAKLLYVNRTLNNSSLNERQKSKIVENVQRTKTLEEAKAVFESLQSAVDSSSKRKIESLSEAIVRPSTLLISRKDNQQSESFDALERMRVLAGIKNKK